MQALPPAAWHKACSSIKALPPRPLRGRRGWRKNPRVARKSGNISRKRKGEKGTKFLRSSLPPSSLLAPTVVVVVVIIIIILKGGLQAAARSQLLHQLGAADARANPRLSAGRRHRPPSPAGLAKEKPGEKPASPGEEGPRAPHTHTHKRDSILHRLLYKHLVQPQPMEIYAGHNREQDFVPSLPPPSPLFSPSLPFLPLLPPPPLPPNK